MLFNPLEQFQIISLFPIVLGNGFDFSITNSTLVLLLVPCLFFFLIYLCFFISNPLLVPSRWQVFFEGIYPFIFKLVHENLGNKAHKFFPLIFTVFTFLLFSNLIGMVPYSFTAMSHLILTFCLALSMFIGINVILVREHGLHALSLFLPAGAPMALLPLLIGVELLSYFIRVITLSVRLFANLMSGHILLHVLLGFAWSMASSNGFVFFLQLVPLFVVFLLIGLEFGVAIIQAYVFSLLLCIYLHDALYLH